MKLSTTGLVVELLTIGFESLMWFALFFCAFLGTEWVSVMWEFAKGSALIVGLAAAVVAYPLGIIFDEVSDSLTGWFERLVFRRVTRIDPGEMWAIQIEALKTMPELELSLNYLRGRLRIARATFLNFIVISIGLLFFPWESIQAGGVTTGSIRYLSAVGALLFSSAAAFVYYRLVKSYWLRVRAAHKARLGPQAGSQDSHDKN